MRTAPYRNIEKAARTHDGGGMWERWRFGRLLLVDDQATTPNGNLRDGVIDALIRAAERDGLSLSRREIQRRLQAGKAYPTEPQLRHAVAQFETWRDLALANFPEVEAPEGAPPYDPRSTGELMRAHDGRGGRLLPDAHQIQLDLFPHHDDSATLGEAQRWADEQAEITRRFAARDRQRGEYLDELLKAVDGDLTKTLGEARAALEGEEST